MANPVASIMHARFILSDSSDRSSKYSFGITAALEDGVGGLVGAGSTDINNLTGTLIDFLNTTIGSAAHPLCFYLGHSASRASNASEIALFDVSNALGLHEIAGPPYTVLPFTLGASSTAQTVPEQVCQTIAWRAGYGSDEEFGTHTRPRADDRNRMYFGPLSTATYTEDEETPTRVTFNTQFQTDVFDAFVGMRNALLTNGGSSNEWVVMAWSRKNAAIKPAIDFSQQLYPTTQRRRISKRPNLIWTPLS